MLLIQAASSLPSDASAFDKAICALRSSIAAAESSINTLGGKSAFWEKWPSWLSVAAVVLGVVMEFLIIRYDWHEDMEAWALTFFGLHRPAFRPSRRKFWVEVISVALVSIGVIGELAIGIRIAVINGDLRRYTSDLQIDSDQLVALATLEAGSAASSANRAQHSADTANASAKTAGQIANELLEDAKWRVLNPKFAEYLKGKPTGTFRVQFSAEDKDETFHLAQQFCIAFIYAGWKYAPPSDLHVDCPSSIPLKYLSRRDPNMPQSAVLPGKELRVLRGSQLSDSSGAALRVLHTAMGFALKGRKKTDFSWAGGEILEDVERGGIILLVEPRQHRVIENNNAKPK